MEIFDDLNSKMKMIEEQLLLLTRKSSVFNELVHLDQELEEIHQLQRKINEIIVESNAELREEYEELKEIVSTTTRLMLFALGELEKKTESKIEKSPQFLNVRHPPNSTGMAAYTPLSASRIALQMYTKSPLIKKKTKSLMFSDFEAEIKPEHFNQIPSYIRGRITISELQDFLDNVLIKCFNAKYEIYYKNRTALTPGDFRLQQAYRSQATYVEGENFITLGDLARSQNRNVDKKEEKYLQNLRFLKIIREVRNNSTTCYIWMNKV